LPASLSQLARKVRVLPVEERVNPEVRVVVADHQDVDVAGDAVVEDVLDVPTVV